MTLVDVISTVLKTAEKLKPGPAANEANTKALLIEPVLGALGWDLYDIDAVEREVKVYDGTFLDYALKVTDGARIYVEAKAISGKLDDKKFISQAVNYANNDGVIWCVLTNGMRYRVFKTNEVASMDRKLLFEVDLAQEHQPVAQKAQQLALISRQSVVNGDLDRYGERVFTDSRVRAALGTLAATPSPAFLAELAGLLGSPAVPQAALRRSLARVLEAPVPTQPSAVHAGDTIELVPPAVALASAGKSRYSLDHHIAGKAVAMRELWEAIDGYVQALGADVERKLNKQSMGYYRGKKAFCSAQVRNNRVLMHVKLDPKSVNPWNGNVMRDVSSIGHWGNGDLEYSLTSVDQFDVLRTLVGRAYFENA